MTLLAWKSPPQYSTLSCVASHSSFFFSNFYFYFYFLNLSTEPVPTWLSPCCRYRLVQHPSHTSITMWGWGVEELPLQFKEAAAAGREPTTNSTESKYRSWNVELWRLSCSNRSDCRTCGVASSDVPCASRATSGYSTRSEVRGQGQQGRLVRSICSVHLRDQHL